MADSKQKDLFQIKEYASLAAPIAELKQLIKNSVAEIGKLREENSVLKKQLAVIAAERENEIDTGNRERQKQRRYAAEINRRINSICRKIDKYRQTVKSAENDR